MTVDPQEVGAAIVIVGAGGGIKEGGVDIIVIGKIVAHVVAEDEGGLRREDPGALHPAVGLPISRVRGMARRRRGVVIVAVAESVTVSRRSRAIVTVGRGVLAAP